MVLADADSAQRRRGAEKKLRFAVRLFAFALSVVLALVPALLAERLPVKRYTTSEGLVYDGVNRIVHDRRGFVWICTAEGLSRFDGFQFTNYTTGQGLPHNQVWDFLETRGGQYWVATTGGLCRLNPAAGEKFTFYRPSQDPRITAVRVLLEDRKGTVWCGTRGGLFQLVEAGGDWALEPVEIGLPRTSPDSARVSALLEDRSGALWIGGPSGLYRRSPDRRAEHYTHSVPKAGVGGLIEDSSGHLWISARDGEVWRQVSKPNPTLPFLARVQARAHALLQTGDGRIWAGVSGGWFGEIIPHPDQSGSGSDRVAVRAYTEAVGSLHDISSITEDRHGDLWMGTGNGVVRIAREGFTTYDEADGLRAFNGYLFTDQSGQICAFVGKREQVYLSRFDGERFVSIWPRSIPVDAPGWGPNRTVQDRNGEWWVGSGRGLFRFARTTNFAQLAEARPKAVYTRKDGLAGDQIFNLHEDARGDLWIALAGSALGLCRWSRAAGTFRCFSAADGVDFLKGTLIYSFAEDNAGQIWIGLWDGGLARYSRGRFTFFPPGDRLPKGAVSKLYCDRAGRLWASSWIFGLVRIDNPEAETPDFRKYTTSHGLPTNDINGITEDDWGRIYLATERGVCRLDPESGQIRQYANKEIGLPENSIKNTFRDRHGALWFLTRSGFSRLIPEADRPVLPPAIFITGLRMAGRSYPVSELGQVEVHGIVAQAHENQLQIEFVTPGAAPGQRLRYQYKIEGTRGDWSPPSDQRTLHLAGLAPGSYRFLVRAVSSDGLASATPALLAFVIQPPLWQRGWFLALATLSLASTVYLLHRYRVRRLIEMERVRTRIATDLHDDIGSSLSQMAILSEVTREQIRSGSGGALSTAGQIAETARTMVDAMSDIVWSIDPRRDDLSSLLQRVRKFASDVLEPQGIVWSFETAEKLSRMKLAAEMRRHIYLILKEALHNAARHAGAKSVKLRMSVADHRLLAEVQDDGRGFSPDAGPTDGYGVESMRDRAAQINGELQIHSAPGKGTRISLQVAL